MPRHSPSPTPWLSISCLVLLLGCPSGYEGPSGPGEAPIDDDDDDDDDDSVDPGDLCSYQGLLDDFGNVLLDSEAAMQSLCSAGQCAIEGTVLVQGDGLGSLAAMGCVRSISGKLDIRLNPQLSSVEGLARLGHVGGGLEIAFNDRLERISGLDALSSVGQIGIHDNGALLQIAGLGSLEVAGSLEISANPLLDELSGLSSLATLQGTLRISGAGGLSELGGLAALRGIGGSLRLDENLRLADLSGLHGIEAINGDLVIRENPALPPQQVEDLLAAIGEGNIGGDVSVGSNGR